MVHRVADGHFQRFGKFCNAGQAVGVAGDKVLGDAVGTHQTPFVVVPEIAAIRLLTTQPDLGQIVKPPVLVDLFGRNVTVVVDQRHFGGIVVKEVLCSFGFQKKIPVHKVFHSSICEAGKLRIPPFH
ncbi:hypothetical protein DSECCO2_603320 [anaerobic digester metagenome]